MAIEQATVAITGTDTADKVTEDQGNN